MELEDLNIPSITDDEAAFLQSLENETPSLSDVPGGDAANDEALALQGATGTALMALNMIEGFTKSSVHPQFAWHESEKQTAAEQIAPALVKNGGELPEWLQPYKEEVIALFAIGALAFGGYMQVKELRKLDEQKPKPNQTAQPNDVLRSDDAA